jgi:glutathione peroxidase
VAKTAIEIKQKQFMLARILKLFTGAAALFLLYVFATKNGMTFKQALLKKMYTFIMLPGKLFGNNSGVLYNLSKTPPPTSIYTILVQTNTGETINLEKYKGKKIVIVNTASDCGFTGQYAELETLYNQHKNNLVVLAFPANDFKNQESGNDNDIANFCKKNYGVTFPIFAKGQVIAGKQQNEIFYWLSNAKENGWSNTAPTWNFCKYVINEQGVLTHFFKNTVSPLSKDFINAVE